MLAITVFTKIQELEEITSFSKHDQIVNGIINSIDEKILVKGDMLPSVNTMVDVLGFARKTIVKAYTDLKERGIIESRNRLGYFVVNESTDQTIKVALILYAFHTFQEEFYNTFRKSLGENIQLEIFFHHNNMDVFESILSTVKSQYGMYVIAPIQHPKSIELLSPIPSNKLLIVDRFMEIGENYSFVTQKFEDPFFSSLESLKERLEDFSSYTLFFKENTDYPIGVLDAYQKFMTQYKWNGEVKRTYEYGTVKKGTVYFTINDNDLWKLLKDCEEQKLIIGKDVGILAHNDNPVKEIICGGISTFSTDFKIMAQKAAKYVLDKNEIQEFIPSVLIRRSSL